MGDTIRLTGTISVSTFNKAVTIKIVNGDNSRKVTAYTNLNGQFTYDLKASTLDIGALSMYAYHYIEARAVVATANISGIFSS